MVVADLPAGELAGGTLDVLCVHLDGVSYALPLDAVLEVLPAVAAVPLPRSPAVIQGVINVRGRLVPLLDLRARLALLARPPRAEDHFVVCLVGRRTVAVRVDRAEALMALSPDDVHTPGAVAPAEHLAGVVRLRDGILLVCDVESFLGVQETLELDGALTDSAPGSRVGR